VRQILHIDMDAFFASVEQRDDPSLRGRPVLVGGPSRRGVVAAASYEARVFGVHSAMPMVQALRRCPQAIVVAPRHGRYAEVSDQLFGIFRRFTPLVEGLSVDEAFLDVTACQALFGDGESMARQIKHAIRTQMQLTASAGVAPNKFVAKIASDLQKPDGLVVVTEDRVEAFLAPLPIERMWGVGPVAAQRLHDAGLRTIGDLAREDPNRLERLVGSWGREVHQLARGIDTRPVQDGLRAKSIGAEQTYDQDIGSRAAMEHCLLDQAQRVAHRLLREGLAGRTVVVKVKYPDFTLQSRRVRVAEPVSDTASICAVAVQLLDRFPLKGKKVRLTGIAVTDLCPQPTPSLFPDAGVERQRRVDQLMLQVHDRFGSKGLQRASLADDDASETRKKPSSHEPGSD
jgi:DNA polymerase IV